jgi:hypothetical protein
LNGSQLNNPSKGQLDIWISKAVWQMSWRQLVGSAPSGATSGSAFGLVFQHKQRMHLVPSDEFLDYLNFDKEMILVWDPSNQLQAEVA